MQGHELDALLATDWGRLLGQQTIKKAKESLLSANGPTIPPSELVFRAFELTSYADTKVVILGQDPYPGTGQADGLAFSVPCGYEFPPTLMNVFAELRGDLCLPLPDHGRLDSWARQGVLLLNTALTVTAGASGVPHRARWKGLTDAVLELLNQKEGRVVFILWGGHAQARRSLIDAPQHWIISSSHPSPLSASKPPKPFFGSRPFSEANRALEEVGIGAVDWVLGECPDDWSPPASQTPS
jgi:uracil-DNA glycosylase